MDYNVPVGEGGRIEDNTRILETFPTLRYLLEKEGAVILMSHLGRPMGKPARRYSLRPIGSEVQRLLQRKVQFVDDCVGIKVDALARQLNPGEILLLENLRFHPEEEENDISFARALASLGEVFVNDAFGVSHRKHASVVGIAQFLPAVAGFLVEKELQVLSELLYNLRRPYFAILGGAKISDKIGVVENLLRKVDRLLIGGAMAFTFLKAEGIDVGNSLVDESQMVLVQELLRKYRDKIRLPSDCLAARGLSEPGKAMAVTLSVEEKKMQGLQGFDIGPQTIAEFSKMLREEKPQTIFWNGPMGVFEVSEFATGTLEMARVLGECAGAQANVVVGGGDSIAALGQLGLAKVMTHLSTGGGCLPRIFGREGASGPRRPCRCDVGYQKLEIDGKFGNTACSTFGSQLENAQDTSRNGALFF